MTHSLRARGPLVLSGFTLFALVAWFGYKSGIAAPGDRSAIDKGEAPSAPAALMRVENSLAPVTADLAMTPEQPEEAHDDPATDSAVEGDPQVIAQQAAYTLSQTPQGSKERIIRVGLVTKGGDIALLSSSPMLVSDGGQEGRRLTVPASTLVVFSKVPSQSIRARNTVFSGTVQIKLPGHTYGAWRIPRIWVAGGPTRIATDGGNPRYNRAYHGSFEVSPQTYSFEPAQHKSPLRLVNIISLEDYLRGVVPWEMNAGAPLEALKAQAICARSETLAKIEAGRHTADGFDICDYDHCQGYSGTENEKPSSDRAVRETAGLVLFHGGRVADAVYGTNSGGISADKNDVWRGPAVSYLKSVYDFSPSKHPAMARIVKSRMTENDWVAYCSQNLPSYAQPGPEEVAKLAARRRNSARTAALFQEGDLPEFYRWSRTITPVDLGAAMAARVQPGVAAMKVATEIRVLDRAPSGHIKKLAVFGLSASGQPTSVTFEKDSQIRSMLSGRLGSTTSLPSSTFVILPRRDAAGNISNFVLKGAGWGHGAGMCQRGAQNHALEGWSARQIIAHYFQGIQLRKIQ